MWIYYFFIPFMLYSTKYLKMFLAGVFYNRTLVTLYNSLQFFNATARSV